MSFYFLFFYECDTDHRARYVVATTTIWSGASYVYSKDAVKILTQPAAAAEEGKKKANPEDKKDSR